MTSFILIAVLVIFFLILLGSFLFLAALNKCFWQQEMERIFYYSLIFNICFHLLFIFGRRIPGVPYELMRFLNYYLGLVLYAFLISVVFWLIYIVFSLFKKQKLIAQSWVGKLILLVFLTINFLAIYNFEKPIAVEQYTIESNKVTKPYKFVQFNDVQYGTVDKDYMDKVLRLVYAQNPDFIVFIGDLIDFNGYELEDFDVFAESKVPIYFERGNHEFYHDPKRILSYLQKSQPVKILINQKDSFDEIEIVGIDHNSNYFQLRDKLADIELDAEKFSVLIYHEPKGVEFALEKDFDLMLFAHTHAGQMWPVTEIIDLMYEYGDGYFEVDEKIIYTSDGAALWGPKMRLDSQNEIVVFNIVPK